MHLPESLHSNARELRRRFHDGGTRGALDFLTTGVRAQLSKHEERYVIVKSLDDVVAPLRRGQVRMEVAEQRHAPALLELNRERGDLAGDARFAADLAAGHGGFVGFCGEQLVSCYWWVDAGMPPHRDMRELGLGIELGERDVYGYDLYVHKGHRAGGTVNDFLFQVERALQERGYERLWGAVVGDNRTARWTYASRGYVPMWKVERTRVLRRWSNRIVRLDEQGTGA